MLDVWFKKCCQVAILGKGLFSLKENCWPLERSLVASPVKGLGSSSPNILESPDQLEFDFV